MPREVLDFYETAPWQVRYLLSQHQNIKGDIRICEPACGDGAISNLLRNFGYLVVTNDVDKTRPADFHLDATLADSWRQFGSFDWVIMNPPFSVSFYILRYAYLFAKAGVALLQRTTYKEPTLDGKGFWMMNNPPSRQLTMPRYSYKKTEKSSNDSATHDWFIWDKSIIYPPHLHPHVIGYDAKSY